MENLKLQTQLDLNILFFIRSTPIRSNYFVDVSLTIPGIEVSLLTKGITKEYLIKKRQHFLTN